MKQIRQRILKLRRALNVQFALRALPALSVFVCYFINRDALDYFGGNAFSFGFLKKPLVLFVWIFLLIDLTIRVFPLSFRSIGMKKAFACSYKPVKEGNKPDKKTIRKLQKNAIRSFLFYFFFNALYGVPYLLVRFGVLKPGESSILPEAIAKWLQNLGAPELTVIVMLYYLIDLIFIRFWCIFRNVLNKNRCCADCRINCWDGLMYVTPMILCPLAFVPVTLFAAAFLSFAPFEFAFCRHPERFDPKCNANLTCDACENDVCPRKLRGKKR